MDKSNHEEEKMVRLNRISVNGGDLGSCSFCSGQIKYMPAATSFPAQAVLEQAKLQNAGAAELLFPL